MRQPVIALVAAMFCTQNAAAARLVCRDADTVITVDDVTARPDSSGRAQGTALAAHPDVGADDLPVRCHFEGHETAFAWTCRLPDNDSYAGFNVYVLRGGYQGLPKLYANVYWVHSDLEGDTLAAHLPCAEVD